jgi:ribonuclease BN (tRNA processing enzyme)
MSSSTRCIPEAGYDQAQPAWKEYRLKYHTSSRELAELASKAKPKLLILYHQGYGAKDGRLLSNEEDLLREMKAAYAGKFVSGHDLDVY